MKGPELEALLVGALLDSKEPMKLLQAAGLNPETFSDPQLRVCWDIAGQLAREGRRVDAATLFSAGSVAKKIGAEDFRLLQTLQARNSLGERAFVQVANDLRRQSHQRMLGDQLVALGKDLIAGTPPAKAHPRFTAIAESYSRLHAEGRRGSTAVYAAFDAFDRRRAEGKSLLVPTGFDLIDAKTNGGFPPKLCVLVGEPGIGKSALLATMVERQLLAGLTVVFFSLEDGDEWFVKRQLARRLGLRVSDVFNKAFPDEGRAATAGSEMAEAYERLWFITQTQAQTPEDIVRLSTQYIAQQGASVFWLDNATALKYAPTTRFEKTDEKMGRMYNQFAKFADTFRVPMVVLAHTTRKYEERTQGKAPPNLSDISDSSGADRDVRFAAGLWRKSGAFRFTVLKQTEAEKGFTLEFGMHTDAAVVDHEGGAEIDLNAEAREDRKRAADREDESSVARGERRKELRERYVQSKKPPPAPEAPPAPPQVELFPEAKP